MSERNFKSEYQFVQNQMRHACSKVKATNEKQMRGGTLRADRADLVRVKKTGGYGSKREKLSSKEKNTHGSVMIQGVVSRQSS